MAQRVKRLPAMQETRVQSLGPEDPLEKEIATDSGTPAWKIPWTEESGRLQSMGSQRVDTTEQLHFSLFPGGPVAKTPCSQSRGPGFDHLLGN